MRVFKPLRMLYTVKEDLELCRDYKLSPMQLMFIKTLVNDPSLSEGEQAKEKNSLGLKFQTIFSKMNKSILASELSDLISRDIIIDHNHGDVVYFDLYELSGKWRNKLRLAIYPMPQELWDKYPLTGKINNSEYVARNISPEDLAKMYLKAIDKDPEEHKKVLDDLDWAIKNDELKVGLKKFVEIKYWLIIRSVRSKGQKGGFTSVNIS